MSTLRFVGWDVHAETITAVVAEAGGEVRSHGAIPMERAVLLRWLEVPEFQQRYLEARRKAVQQAIARVQQATGAASLTVLKLVTDPNVPPAVRLRAAECVFVQAIKGIEIEDIETRLAALEQATEESHRKK
jgi:hypothetical protein